MAGKAFISLRKAVHLTGKSERKLLKLWQLYQNTPNAKLKNGKRYISRLLLEKSFKPSLNQAYAPVADNAELFGNQVAEPLAAETQADLVKHLIGQLEEKDKQLAARDAQITQLIERTREQNNIIFSLEQHQQRVESKLSIPLHSGLPETKMNQTPINYALIALIMLLVGIVVVIFYVLLAG